MNIIFKLFFLSYFVLEYSVNALEIDFDISKTQRVPKELLEKNPQYNYIRGNREPNFDQKFYDGQSIDVIKGNITNSLNHTRRMQSLSTLDDKATISQAMNLIYKDGKGPKVFDKGQGVYVPNVFSSYNVNNNETVRVNLKDVNSQYGTDLFELKGMFKNQDVITSGKTYYMNYSLSDNIIYSKSYESTYDPDYIDDYVVKCNYTSYPMTFNYRKLSGFNFFMTTQFRLGAFALKESKIGIFFIQMKNDTLDVSSIKPYLSATTSTVDVDTTEFKKIFIIDQPYEEKTFLVAETKDGDLLYYQIVLNTYGQIYYMFYHTTINPYKISNCNEITSVAYVDLQIAIATDKGLLIYERDATTSTDTSSSSTASSDTGTSDTASADTTITDSAGTDSTSTDIVDSETSSSSSGSVIGGSEDDIIKAREGTYTNIRNMDTIITSSQTKQTFSITHMIVLEYMIYTLVENYGIKVIEISSMGFVDYEFQHSYFKSLDLVVNPLLNTKYLGITMKTTDQINDFFLELNVDDELYPEINKIFLSSELNTAKHYMVLDLFLGLFYDPSKNSLLIIRRGMLNNIPFQTYKYDLSKYFSISENSDIVVTSLYNPSTELNEFFIVDNTNSITHIISDFDYGTDRMYCKFDDIGSYNVTLEKYSEACSDSLSYNYAYSYCDFIIYLNFQAIGEDLTSFALMGVVLGSLGGLIFLIFLFFFIVKTECCRDFSMFTGKKKPKARPTREELYVDNYLTKKKDLKKRMNVPNDTEENIVSGNDLRNNFQLNNNSNFSNSNFRKE